MCNFSMVRYQIISNTICRINTKLGVYTKKTEFIVSLYYEIWMFLIFHLLAYFDHQMYKLLLLLLLLYYCRWKVWFGLF